VSIFAPVGTSPAEGAGVVGAFVLPSFVPCNEGRLYDGCSHFGTILLST
jgi:hypothetical protein